MITGTVGVVCLGIGVYAGKKRAAGKSWTSIANDLGRDSVSTAKAAWGKVVDLFSASMEVKPCQEDGSDSIGKGGR